MGTTASTYIERRKAPETNWSGEKIRIFRNYEAFDALAGGRNGKGFLYSPRGLPHDISEVVLRDACFRLTEPGEQPPAEGSSLVRDRSVGPPLFEFIRRGDADYTYSPVGYVHSHSWLTLDEISASLQRKGIDRERLDETWASMLRRMKELEVSGHQVRLIVWFDAGPVSCRRLQVFESIDVALRHDWRPIDAAGLITGTDGAPPDGADDYSRYVSPVFRILSGSRSEPELMSLLDQAERKDLGLPGSSRGRLRTVARNLLSLDVAYDTPEC